MIKNILTSAFCKKSSKLVGIMSYCDAKIIFDSALRSVCPENLIRKYVRVDGKILHVADKSYRLHKQCYLVGFGKAVLNMALQMEYILDKNLKSGIVMIPEGAKKGLPEGNFKIKYLEGAKNNLPDMAAMQGAKLIKELCDCLKEDDLLIVLISGGGSALLPLPKDGIQLDEKLTLIKELANKGADIIELNCLRKRMSQLKGGGLAECAFPSRVISLILSDIIGDPLDFIASGPTVRNLDDPEAPLNILRKYNLTSKLPHCITNILNDSDTKTRDIRVDNLIIGNNQLAANSAKECAVKLEYDSVILSTKIQGDVVKLAKMYAELAAKISILLHTDKADLQLANFKDDFVELNALSFNKNVCIIAGGEPTVVVEGTGIGGRNQQLILQFSKEISRFDLSCGVTLLSCGTDGIDGPTDAAGAVATDNLYRDALEKEDLDPEVYLKNNDTNTFFRIYRNGECLIKTGHTGTNVMDIHVLIIKRR